jgi:hypothetical protein
LEVPLVDTEPVLEIIRTHGPLQAAEITRLLAVEGLEEPTSVVTTALRKLEARREVACTPRDNWRLAGEAARVQSAARRAASEAAPTGVRTRALIYCPEIIRDVPRLKRNTILHFLSYEHGGFRLRDYVDGRRIEIKEVAGITKTIFLEATYHWTLFEFDAEEAATPLVDNEFWEKRIAQMNESHAAMLEAGEAVASSRSAA